MRSLFKTLAAATDGGLTGQVNSILSGMHAYACRYRWPWQGYQRMDDAPLNRIDERGGRHVMPCHSHDGTTLHGAERLCSRNQKLTNVHHKLDFGQHLDQLEHLEQLEHAQAINRQNQVSSGQGSCKSLLLAAALKLPPNFGFRIFPSPLAQIDILVRNIRNMGSNVNNVRSLGPPCSPAGDQSRSSESGHATEEGQAPFNRAFKLPPRIGRRLPCPMPKTLVPIGLCLRTNYNDNTGSPSLMGKAREDWAHYAPCHAWGKIRAPPSSPSNSIFTRHMMGCIHCWDDLFKHHLPSKQAEHNHSMKNDESMGKRQARKVAISILRRKIQSMKNHSHIKGRKHYIWRQLRRLTQRILILNRQKQTTNHSPNTIRKGNLKNEPTCNKKLNKYDTQKRSHHAPLSPVQSLTPSPAPCPRYISSLSYHTLHKPSLASGGPDPSEPPTSHPLSSTPNPGPGALHTSSLPLAKKQFVFGLAIGPQGGSQKDTVLVAPTEPACLALMETTAAAAFNNFQSTAVS